MGGNFQLPPKPYVLVPPLPNRKKRPLSPSASGSNQQSRFGSEYSRKRGRTESTVPLVVPDSVSPTPPLVSSRYEQSEDEIDETQDLRVYGESTADAENSDDEEDMPVRRLDDFYIYDMSTMEVVLASVLETLNFNTVGYGASGIVRPWVEKDGTSDDSDSDSEESVDIDSYDQWDRVKLSKILEYNAHNVESNALDHKMYLRTKHAWYVLGEPAPRYHDSFVPLWTRHRIAHLFFSAANQDGRLTMADFRQTLQEFDEEEEAVVPTTTMLERDLTPEDLDLPEIQAYLISTAEELQEELNVKRSVLVRAINALNVPFHLHKAKESPFADSDYSARNASHRSANGSKKDGPRQGRKKDPVSIICTTPIISRLTENLFEVKMNSLDNSRGASEDIASRIMKANNEHHFALEKVQWGRELEENVYGDVNIDGVRYEVGDVVMVLPDADYKAPDDNGRTSNAYGDNYWFCQIHYFVERKTSRGTQHLFHGQWFAHGSRTFINEVAHPGSLYLLNSCEENTLDCIFQKCNFQLLKPGDPEPPVPSPATVNDFHCSLMYDEDSAEYVDLPDAYLTPQEFSNTYCCACWTTKEREAMDTPLRHGDSSFSYGGYLYHEKDFVYLRPSGDSKLLDIGQITEIHGKENALMVSIQYLKRYIETLPPLDERTFSKASESPLFYDERQLMFTSTSSKVISPSTLSGVCYIKWLVNSEEIDKWTCHNDHFYVYQIEDEGEVKKLPKAKFTFCKICLQERVQAIQEEQDFLKSNGKLVAMELFCGAGGLGLGMELSQHVETRFAVEYFSSAALTFKKNHPNAKVYCQDSNLLLKQAVEESSGEHPPPLDSLHPDLPMPKMPSKEINIDFILGGPPCQGFSRMNHNRQADDFRTSMPCNMLSFAEHYDPSYFLLENVGGLLDFKLFDNREGCNGEVIEKGMLKFITRALIALGYQVRWKMCQAAQYGVPQSRTRLIIWGIKRGLVAPKFPIPTHAFDKGVFRPLLPGGLRPPAPTRALIDGDYHQCAPFPTLSVFDAIGDLPSFDWDNPHIIQKPPPKGTDADRNRTWHGKPIHVLDAVLAIGADAMDGTVGYLSGARYPVPPMNRYQKFLRKGMKDASGKEAKVEGQYTKCFHANVIESTVSVPLRPRANHRDLPLSLQPRMAQPGKKQVKKSFYGRVGGNEHFKCALTQLSPNIKGTWPLHPLQQRIYSLLEIKRSQGFPDHYKIYSTSKTAGNICKDQIKQVGNAVAVPFAHALGRELGLARFAGWRKKERQGSPEL